MKTLTEVLTDRALSDVNNIETRNAKELAAKATSEIAHAKKFWSMWDADVRTAKVHTFTRRARDMRAKASELQRGRFDAQFDYGAIVMLYVTAIRELTRSHFSL